MDFKQDSYYQMFEGGGIDAPTQRCRKRHIQTETKTPPPRNNIIQYDIEQHEVQFNKNLQ
jgi:hypothetical protein